MSSSPLELEFMSMLMALLPFVAPTSLVEYTRVSRRLAMVASLLWVRLRSKIPGSDMVFALFMVTQKSVVGRPSIEVTQA